MDLKLHALPFALSYGRLTYYVILFCLFQKRQEEPGKIAHIMFVVYIYHRRLFNAGVVLEYQV